jgi:hypothetical protein
MQDFARRFVRHELGVWVCVQPAELNLPAGRMQVAVGTRFIRGTQFMGVDVAQLLEEHYDRTRQASS